MNTSVKAYAKINLFLDIESLRADRYHNILSVMQSVSLCDIVTVDITPSDFKEISIQCTDPDVPCDEKNLAYRAASIFPIKNVKIDIHIDKHIPMSAGLAGGSADAAATLIGLNKLCKEELSCDELKALGAKLGADVPFCIECGTCLTQGIGDIMSGFTPMPKLPIVIAKKGDGMSTPLAYSCLDKKFNNFINYTPHSNLLEALSSSTCNSDYVKGLFNIFECVVEAQRPDVTSIKQIMLSCGALRAMMSGSGTSVFGIFETEEKAKSAITELTSFNARAFLCYPCDSAEQV